MDSRTTRRRFFGALAVAAGGGFSAGALLDNALTEDPARADENRATKPETSANKAVSATGKYQAGISRPSTPQAFSLTTICDISGEINLSDLANVGDQLLQLTNAPNGHLGDLTVTVGIGPRLVSSIDPKLPGEQPLPAFAGDEKLPADRVGGDLLLIVSVSDPSVLQPTTAALVERLTSASVRWSQFGFRGPGRDGIVRNSFGFHDGIIVPRGDDELKDNVWLSSDPRVAGGTLAVIRRLKMNLASFGELSEADQEAAVGRKKGSGEPLSGGKMADQASLTAKTPDGHYLTPLGSHVRATHPATTGSGLMLRRGYSYAEDDEFGLVFTCFQRDLRTFIATQQRIDETDLMMRHVTVTASANFLILPGFDRDRPLGSTLA